MRESAQIKALYAILQAIKQILNGKPTILRSVDSFHIYQPIEPNSLDQIKKFIDNVIAQYPELQLVLRIPELILDSFYAVWGCTSWVLNSFTTCIIKKLITSRWGNRKFIINK
jgi:hypothetical protein